MVSEQDSPRPLLTPGEVLQFPQDEALVMAGGHPPYRGLKVRYFSDRRFKDRVGLPCPNEARDQQAEYNGLRPPIHWLKRSRVGRPSPPAIATHKTVKSASEPMQNSGTNPVNNNPQTTSPANGGVRLEGEVQQHPQQGRELEQMLASLAEQKRVRPTKQPDRRAAEQDKEKDELMEQLERIRRNRQQTNQRTIEQARQPGGGGLPL